MRRISIELRDEDRAYLDSCSRIRDISLSALLRRIITTITTDQMVGAILDDSDQPRQVRKGGEYGPYGKRTRRKGPAKTPGTILQTKPIQEPAKPPSIELSGRRMGLVEVQQYMGVDLSGTHVWKVKCECGVERRVDQGNLLRYPPQTHLACQRLLQEGV